MANVVRDPRTHPDAILPDLTKPDPLLTFKKEDIAFVYGSKWKQRYFQEVRDDYYPLGAQWDVTNQMWRPYHVGAGTDGGYRSIRRRTTSGRQGRRAAAAIA
jgi:hypothetical protein